MGIFIGTVTYPDLRDNEKIIHFAASYVGMEFEFQTTVLNSPGCCMGMMFFNTEKDSKDERVAVIGNSVLMWTGYITDIHDLKKRAEASGTVFDDKATDSLIPLESYFRLGMESLQGLNGLYSIIIWDDTQKRFSAITDRYGFTKIYYWLNADGLIVASECKAIISHPKYRKAMDKEGIVNFLGAGYCFGERTLFKDIKLIPQGCTLTYKDTVLSFKKYWDYSVNPVSGTLDKLTDKFFFYLEGAFKRCINGEESVFIPLSGGLDSRTMAAIANINGLQIYGCTIGRSRSMDVRYGRKIGERICSGHTVLPLGSDYIRRYGSKGVSLTNGMVLNEVFYILRLLDYQGDGNTFISGFLGDVLSGGKLADSSLSVNKIIKQKFLYIFDSMQLHDITDPSLEPLIGVNEAYLATAMNNAHAEARCDKAMIVELKERQRRFTNFYFPFFERRWDIAAPFTDRYFVDFALTLPVEPKINQKLYKNVILKKLPLVADIPVDKTGKRMCSTWWSWRWENVKRMVPNNIKQKFRTGDNRNWVVDCDDAIRTGSAPYFRDLFSDREHMAGLFNIKAVDRLFRSHLNREANEYRKLCAIATIIEWRRQFMV